MKLLIRLFLEKRPKMNSFVYHSEECSQDNRKFKIYRLTNFITTDPIYALSVVLNKSLNKDNKLTDLPGIYETELLMHNRDDIQRLHNDKKRFLFVLDITNFPYVGCSFDCRDPNEDKKFRELDKFDHDIIREWNN